MLNLLTNAADAVEEAHGTGISDVHAPRIFDAYFTSKPEGKGTGQGLAITARLMHAGGGEVVHTPGPLGGARFSLGWRR